MTIEEAHEKIVKSFIISLLVLGGISSLAFSVGRTVGQLDIINKEIEELSQKIEHHHISSMQSIIEIEKS